MDTATHPGKGATTRAAIADSARKLFTENGYRATSVRAIAGAVGVDPALVVRYFGSKERLFLETVRFPGIIDRALDGPDSALGRRIVEAVFDGDTETRLNVFAELMRASGSDTVRARLREAGEATFVRPLLDRLRGPDAELRARLIAGQVHGLLAMLALGDGVLGDDAARDRVVATYGAAVQALVDPPD